MLLDCQAEHLAALRDLIDHSRLVDLSSQLVHTVGTIVGDLGGLDVLDHLTDLLVVHLGHVPIDQVQERLACLRVGVVDAVDRVHADVGRHALDVEREP